MPPVYCSSASSVLATGTSTGASEPRCRNADQACVWPSSGRLTRCPSLRSLAIVNNSRNVGGKYSLMLVTTTCFSAGQLRSHRLNAWKQRRQTHDHAGIGVLELVLELRFDVQRAGWHEHGAGAQAAVVGDHHLRAVGHQQRDAVALAHAQGDQRVGKVGRGVIQLAVGDRAPEKANRGAARIALCRGFQQPVQRCVGNVDRVWHARVVPLQPGSVGLHVSFGIERHCLIPFSTGKFRLSQHADASKGGSAVEERWRVPIIRRSWPRS